MNLSKNQLSWEERAKQFAAKEIVPNREKLETDLEFRKTLYQKMAKEGFFDLSKDFLAYILALKAIAAADTGTSVTMAVTNMVAEVLQKSPEMPFALAMTEEDAGSDVKNIKTTAKKTDSGFLLTGEKWFITNGDIAEGIVVTAKGEAGISAFLVEEGWEVIRIEEKMGVNSVNLASIRFQDSPAQLIGEEGHGIPLVLRALDMGRLGIAAQSVGIAEAALKEAISFAKTRIQFQHPLSDFEAIQFKLADMVTALDAGKALLYTACSLKEQGKPITQIAAEAKLFCSEMCQKVTDEAVQIFGGRGYLKSYPVERYFRDARVTTLYEGTSEIQRLVISKSILMD